MTDRRCRTPGRVSVLGIRHHGPGSARSVVAELDRLRPAAVLIEGPADADPLLALAADPGMVPPVALLAYAPDEPRVSAFWPFAVFSPEWQALTWAAAQRSAGRGSATCPPGWCWPPSDRGSGAGDGRPTARSEGEADAPDPIGQLAAAAGYDDPERWWDDVIESRLRPAGDARRCATAPGVRRHRRGHGRAAGGPDRKRCTSSAARRTCGRCCGRRSRKPTGPVAVVCGAWHVPALTAPLPPAVERRRAAARRPRSARRRSPGCRGRTPGWRPRPGTAPGSPRRAGTTTCSRCRSRP